MRQCYKDYSPRGETLTLIRVMNTLISSYAAQGFKLSVRQLYYQLVARDYVPNTEQSYKRVAGIVNDARVGGIMDWDAIEDRNRDIEMKTRWSSASQIIQASASSFHMDMWDNQSDRVYVIVEKAALAGVLEGVCRKYDVPMLAARGYPSVSIVREMVEEHFAPAAEAGQDVTILHLGDHDPSGIDMTRDLKDRIQMFMEPHYESSNACEVIVKRIALSMQQIVEAKAPPNPAKQTDSRFQEYARLHGNESWELDALEPSYLVRLLTSHIDGYIDQDLWDERSAEVESKRDELQETATKFAKKGI